PRGTDPSREEKETQTDQVERHHGPRRPPERPVPPHAPWFVPTDKQVVPNQERPVVQTVEQVAGLDSVPEPHELESEEEAQVRGRVLPGEPAALGGGQHKSHVHMIAEPGGEADVPAIPEVRDIGGQKGPVEVLWRVNAQQVADTDGEGAVSG